MRFRLVGLITSLAALAGLSAQGLARDLLVPDYPFSLSSCNGEPRKLRWYAEDGQLIVASIGSNTNIKQHTFDGLKGQRLVFGRSCVLEQTQFVPAVTSEGDGLLLILDEKTGVSQTLRVGRPFMFLGLTLLGTEIVLHGSKGEAGYISRLTRSLDAWALADEIKVNEVNLITSVGVVGGNRFAAGLIPDRNRPAMTVFPLTVALSRADAGRRLPCGPSFADVIDDKIVLVCPAQFSIAKSGVIVHKISANFREINSDYLPNVGLSGFVSSICQGRTEGTFAFVGTINSISSVITMQVSGTQSKNTPFKTDAFLLPPQGIDCVRKSSNSYVVTNGLRLATRMTLPPMRSVIQTVVIE